ncbi:ABC transporter substrate-binding protein [Paenibacillus sp. CAA11]|uniref:ABC transporter substrate-binding protein n=1 Tax=Paenibacillus sp. CAA11 TaxID=1532905 RepID=UPI000D360E99|nr:extracellular solute-binding protein [Paenibacillus sp. CAA11]AWB45334.1 ABC transporter substrate-binding protein [Paenibacillus sp. CAA11]
MKLKKIKKVLVAGLATTFLLSLLAGCSGEKSSDSKEEKVLRIGMLYGGGGGDDSYLRQQYTDVFEYSHPNVKIEFVYAIDQSQYRYSDGPTQDQQPDAVESMKKIMTGSNPVDVIMLDTSSLRDLIQENMVKQLDPLIQEDKLDMSDFVPTIMDGLKEIGDNKLYAMASTFSSSALFYNKKAFQAAGVEPPKDGMTWDETFNLATRVAKGEGKNRMYGFDFSNYVGAEPYMGVTMYAEPLQLRYFDDKAEKMTVNTPQWEKVWSTISKYYRDKVILDSKALMEEQQNDNKTNYNEVSQDPFLSGRVAMVLADSSYVNTLIDANENAGKVMKNFKPVDWDIVTAPVHPEKPGVGGNMYINNAFAINASAPNPDTAWDFVKFQASEEWAKLKSRSSYEMVSRKSYIKPVEGKDYNVAAFYTLKPTPQMSSKDQKLITEKPGLSSVRYVGSTFFQQVLENKKTPAEALKAYEQKGNEMLQAIKNNPKTMFQPDGTPYVPQENGK